MNRNWPASGTRPRRLQRMQHAQFDLNLVSPSVPKTRSPADCPLHRAGQHDTVHNHTKPSIYRRANKAEMG